MSYRIGPVVVVASLLALEGVSFARTPSTQPAQLAPDADSSAKPAAVAATHGAATDARRSDADDAADDAMVLHDALARIRVCHISRHPRDGVRSEEHACPLFIAEVAPAAATPAAKVAGPVVD